MTSEITLAGMAPGAKVAAPVTVTNTGMLPPAVCRGLSGMPWPQRYAVASVTTEDSLVAQLELTVKTGVTTCTAPSPPTR